MQCPRTDAFLDVRRSGPSRSIHGKVISDIRTKPQFKHVRCPDEKWETICMKCLLPVGSSFLEEELLTSENAHTCKAGLSA